VRFSRVSVCKTYLCRHPYHLPSSCILVHYRLSSYPRKSYYFLRNKSQHTMIFPITLDLTLDPYHYLLYVQIFLIFSIKCLLLFFELTNSFVDCRSIKSIGSAAFYYSGLRSVVIPTSVTFIDMVMNDSN
jgi:hypothetical protein